MNRTKARKITISSFIINCLLSVAKLLVGFLGRSGALVADGVHSFSDLVTDVIVYISLRLTQKPADERHNYGHGKIEIVATVLVSIALFIAGFSIGREGVMDIIGFTRGAAKDVPALSVVIVAGLSFFIKELLFRFTFKIGKTEGSEVLIANAWHQRSDALSSLGVLIGAGAAIMLGGDFAYLDSVAQIVVSLFIFRAAYLILKPNIGQLADAAIDKDEIDKIKDILETNPGIRQYHHLKTRHVGPLHAVDVHILVDPSLDISRAHDISTEIEYLIQDLFEGECFISVHVEPDDDKQRI